MTPSGAAPERCILLVEDDHALRQSLSEVLRDAGYGVECVDNGREALEYLDANPHPCVVLLDLMMPVMNGWEFREEQLRRPGISTIPVVILTADGHADRRAEALGADGFLRKPVKLDRLFGLLERYGC
jgi:CheY-like chemotaxis protein